MGYLRDFLDLRRILILEGGGKTDALIRLIELSRSDEAVRDFEAFRREVLRRESIVTTGIGMGVAIPHVKTRSLRSFFVSVGVFRSGIDWDSLDGKPVHLAFLIAGPEDHQKYLQILARLARIIRDQDWRRAILAAGEAGEILDWLAGW